MEDLLSSSYKREDLDLPFDGSIHEEHVFDISLEKDKENEEIVAAEKKSENELQNEMAPIQEKQNENVEQQRKKQEFMEKKIETKPRIKQGRDLKGDNIKIIINLNSLQKRIPIRIIYRLRFIDSFKKYTNLNCIIHNILIYSSLIITS